MESINAAAAAPDRIRLPLAFDPTRLAADLAALAEEGWVRHFVRANYDGDWTILPLRAPAGAVHPIHAIFPNPAATAWYDTSFLEASPYFREVLAAFCCPLTVVRLMRLTPGSTINEHCDPDLDGLGELARLHVPILTNPHVDFRIGGVPVRMEAGSCWWLRLADPHSVANRGRSDRVHLVLDVHVNDWLRSMLAAAVGGG